MSQFLRVFLPTLQDEKKRFAFYLQEKFFDDLRGVVGWSDGAG